MALISVHFSSKLLQTQTVVRLIMPDRPINKPLQTIWWLHGLGDDGSAWIRKTRLELFASQFNVAIIIPDMQRSFFQNIRGGLPYFDYLSKELPNYLETIFPLSKNQKDTFLVGNSMGGYGSYKWSALNPDKFSYVATLSPVTNLNTVTSFMEDYQSILGKEPNKITSLFDLMSPNIEQLKKINWIQFMGSDDSLREDSEAFTKKVQNQLNLDLNQNILSGNHNWTFWDEQLPELFKWLPLHKLDSGGNN